jgi:hypothetical protein
MKMEYQFPRTDPFTSLLKQAIQKWLAEGAKLLPCIGWEGQVHSTIQRSFNNKQATSRVLQ